MNVKLKSPSARHICPLAIAALAISCGYANGDSYASEDNHLISPAWNAEVLKAAITAERPAFQPPDGVTGLTVPHHLLAADLIARGFWAASSNRYDRIVLLSPDHFRKVKGAFAVATRDLETVFGPLAADGDAVARLLSHAELFEPATGIESEHGVQAIAPFVRHFFPDVPVVAVVAAIDSPPENWESAAKALSSVVTDRTLIIQSTDFSHYLPLSDAVRRDQESLGLIAAADPESVSGMLQPGHLDSRAAHYVQTVLQKRVASSAPVVIANRNSAEYGSGTESTTSYVVAVFLRDAGDGAVLRYGDQSRVFLGGDTLLGRFMNPILHNEHAVETIAEAVVGFTGGEPLILNLEGVLLDAPVMGVGPGAHIMATRTALPLLRRMNVVAAGVANNHSDDLGAGGMQQTLVNLSSNGITPLQHGQVAGVGGLRVVPVNLHRTSGLATDRAAALAEVGRICEISAEPPLIALMHWGEEYTNRATSVERDLAVRAHECGVSVVVGAHSHQASKQVEALAGGALQLVFSLGNLVFDQRADRGSGAVLEVRMFKQGTVVTRLVALPNLFEAGTDEIAPPPAVEPAGAPATGRTSITTGRG